MPILTLAGNTGESKVKTKVLVGLSAPSRCTLILRTSVTPCSPMNSRICFCSSACLRQGSEQYPLKCSRIYVVLQNISIHKMFSFSEDLLHGVVLYTV